MTGVIDYEAGNSTSVCNALASIGAPFFVSDQRGKLESAQSIIMPGVGEAQSAMQSLRSLGLIEWLRGVEVPFLGICLGMQVLFERSDERDTECLGIIPGTIRRFQPEVRSGTGERTRKIPHMGWNTVRVQSENPLFDGITDESYFYFVHAYYAPVVEATIAVTEYGLPFTTALRRGNFYGVQFHPEKSGKQGLQLLQNFISKC
jgi:imidazole glycerol-phosphate synthase subunit HisH